MNFQSHGLAAFSDWGLGAASDPDITGSMSAAQKGWVAGGIAGVKDAAIKTGTWTSADAADGLGFQKWYNANVAKVVPVKPLRTDGILDQDTLDALQSVVKQMGGSPYPSAACPKGQELDPKTGLCADKKGLSRGAIAGLAAAGAAVVGGIVYVVTKPRKAR